MCQLQGSKFRFQYPLSARACLTHAAKPALCGAGTGGLLGLAGSSLAKKASPRLRERPSFNGVTHKVFRASLLIQPCTPAHTHTHVHVHVLHTQIIRKAVSKKKNYRPGSGGAHL